MTVLIHAAMLALGLALLLAILYLIYGSLEMYPTEEQQSKVRIAMSVVVMCIVAAEALLWGLARYVKRREQPNSSLQSGPAASGRPLS